MTGLNQGRMDGNMAQRRKCLAYLLLNEQLHDWMGPCTWWFNDHCGHEVAFLDHVDLYSTAASRSLGLH